MSRENLKFWRAIVAMAVLPSGAAIAQFNAVCGTTAGGKRICVQFDNRSYAPELGEDFNFVLTDPPSVVLLVGEDEFGTLHEWRVWCQVSATDPTPASINSVSTPNAYDYSVKLINPYAGSPGAANLGDMLLTPQGDHFVQVTQDIDVFSRITGSLSGDFIAKVNSEYEGSVIFEIEGDVDPTASIQLAKPTFLRILGDMNGQIEVNTLDKFYNGTIVVKGRMDGVVDVISPSIHGVIEFNGGDGDLTAEGLDGGVVYLRRESDAPAFGGTARFSSIGPGGQLSVGKLDGIVEISGDVVSNSVYRILGLYAGANARIKIGGSMYSSISLPIIEITQAHPTAALTVDYWGWTDGSDWDPATLVMVGETEYRGNSPNGPDHVWEVTECKGDMNNDGSINPFDVNGFVAGLESVALYMDLYPGLEGSMVYHGDVDCNGTFNTFDIQPFLDRVNDGCCSCGGCGFLMGGGGEMSAEDAAGLFLEYSDASFIGNLVDRIGDLIKSLSGAAAEYWEEVKEYLEKGE